jgi:sugar lactone lactonase YvrE
MADQAVVRSFENIASGVYLEGLAVDYQRNVVWYSDVKDDSDGMALDAEGNVWITGFRSGGFVVRVKPDGTLLPHVETPPGSSTQVRFGGSDMRDCYVNVVPADGGDNLKDGNPLSGASYLYRGRSSVPGMPLSPARFALG